MKLVENWRSFPKWFSVWAMAVLAAAPVAWQALPPDVQAWLPAEWRVAIMVLLFVAGVAGRVTKQSTGEA